MQNRIKIGLIAATLFALLTTQPGRATTQSEILDRAKIKVHQIFSDFGFADHNQIYCIVKESAIYCSAVYGQPLTCGDDEDRRVEISYLEIEGTVSKNGDVFFSEPLFNGACEDWIFAE